MSTAYNSEVILRSIKNKIKDKNLSDEQEEKVTKNEDLRIYLMGHLRESTGTAAPNSK